MDTAEWIIVGILSITLFVFLAVGIYTFVRINDLIKESKKVVIKGQDIAETANDVVENVKGMTSFGRLIKDVIAPTESAPKKSEKPKKS